MDKEFQNQVLSQIGSIADQNKTLLKNYDQLDASTKKAMEELTTLKNTQADVTKTVQGLQKLNAQLAMERRSAFGMTPAERLARDSVKSKAFILGIIKGLELWQFMPAKAVDAWKAIEKDLDTANTPGSTYIASTGVESDIYDVLASYGIFRQFDARMIGTKATNVRVKTARAAAVFVDEAGQINADSTKAGSSLTVTPGKIATLLSVSSELLEDDATNLIQDLLNDMGEAGAYRVDWAALSADGGADSTDGGFTGILGGGGTDRTAASGNTTPATLDYEDVLACVTNLPAGLLQRGGNAWFMNPSILAQMLLIKDTTGRPIFHTALEAPSYGAIGTILGFPVITSAAALSTATAGSRIAALGDPRAMAVRIRRDIQISRSEHWAFDTDEITFRMTMRAGTKVKAATAFQVLKLAAS